MMDQKNFRALCATRMHFLLSGLVYSAWAPMVPYIRDQMALSESVLGTLLLAYGIGGLISMPVAGKLVERFGSQTITRIGALAFPFLLSALLWPTAVGSVAVILVGFGAAAGLLNVSMNVQSVAVEKASSKRLMSGFHSFYSFGGLFGALVISALLAMGFPMVQSAILFSSFLMICILFVGKDLLPQSFDPKPQEGSCSIDQQKGMLMIGLFCFCLFLVEGAALDWGAILLVDCHGFSPQWSGVGYAIFSIAMAISRFYGDQITYRFSEFVLVRTGAVLAAVGIVVATFTKGSVFPLLGFAVMGVGVANIVPIIFGRAAKVGGSSGLTIVTTMGYTGMILGPALIGYVAEYTSLTSSMLMLAAIMGIVAFYSSLIHSVQVIPIPK